MRMYATFLAGILAAGSAQAQTSVALPRVNLDRLALNPSASGSLTIHDGEVLSAGSTRVGLVSHYARGLFIAEPPAQTVAVDRLYGSVLGAFAITDWLQLNAQVPVVINQSAGGTAIFSSPPTSAIAPVTLSLRGGWSQSESFPLNLSAELGAGIALGDPTALVAFAVSTRPTPNNRMKPKSRPPVPPSAI